MKFTFYTILLMTVFSSCNSVTESKKFSVGFAGEDISVNAQIIRDKETKKAGFVSSLTDAWELYAGTSPDSIDFSKSILTVVDYRSAEEIKSAPDKIPASVKNDFTYSINRGNDTSRI